MTATYRLVPRPLILTALCLGIVACGSDQPDHAAQLGPAGSAALLSPQGDRDGPVSGFSRHAPICGDTYCEAWHEDILLCPEDCEGTPTMRRAAGAQAVPDVRGPASSPTARASAPPGGATPATTPTPPKTPTARSHEDRAGA